MYRYKHCREYSPLASDGDIWSETLSPHSSEDEETSFHRWVSGILSLFQRNIKSLSYKLVYKERFRSRFHLWPKAKLWKEAREDVVIIH